MMTLAALIEKLRDFQLSSAESLEAAALLEDVADELQLLRWLATIKCVVWERSDAEWVVTDPNADHQMGDQELMGIGETALEAIRDARSRLEPQ